MISRQMSKMRITVRKMGDSSGGIVVRINESASFEEILASVGSALNVDCGRLFLDCTGGELTSTEVLCDGDVVIASSGEDFRPPIRRKASSVQPCVTTGDCESPILGGSTRNDWVQLNVGGRIFATTRSTLTRHPESMLARMFSGESDDPGWCSATDLSGAYLIDRSSEYFEPLLNFMRHGKLILNDGIKPEGVLEEARFYGISEAIEPLLSMVSENDKAKHRPITRAEFVRLLLATPTTASLRCQGISLEGVDLSRLDLRCINFKMACLRGAKLEGADLSHCSLQMADLRHANLDGATLRGVKMLRVSLQGTSLQDCDFEDPAGSCASLEGANLRGAVFDGSRMAGCNFRVACMKGASLKGCNLRGAILAGTDLENCDLSGCDLTEANLRGANVIGASFNEMTTAIHMSQTVPSHGQRVVHN